MILERILNTTRKELESKKGTGALASLKRLAQNQSPPIDFTKAINGKGIKIIAEVKKASPSRGIIRQDFDPTEIAKTYAENGAAAISVLTEHHYFMGSLKSLADIKAALKDKYVPLLRKDFIYDPFQVHESRAYGADAILLIAAIIPDQLGQLIELSHRLGMTSLVEIHNEKELETALTNGARVIGINNRNLQNFEVSLETTKRLRPLIPSDRIVVSESGIGNRHDIARVASWQVDAVLIGEALMSAPDIAEKMRELQ
jgi:indole-3-glycerol phosphate synthase